MRVTDRLNTDDIEIDIDLPIVEKLQQETHVSEELEEAEMDNESLPFVLKMSWAECKHHLETLNRDNTLEKEWRMRLLHMWSWLVSNIPTPDCYLPSMDRVIVSYD